ncbi:MAG: DUF4124 domain-containing protein [Neisseriaceae bacterium]|nr:DUF4124 domain-containing protein [Neisseriaceae bacterium]
MKYTSLIFSILLLSVGVANAEIYVCKKANGTTEYTSTPQANCAEMPETKVAGYSPTVVRGSYSDSNPAPTFENEQPQVSERKAAAEQRWREAEKALEEGRNTRLGNERHNYVKYQERVKGLEEAAEKARLEYERTR